MQPLRLRSGLVVGNRLGAGRDVSEGQPVVQWLVVVHAIYATVRLFPVSRWSPGRRHQHVTVNNLCQQGCGPLFAQLGSTISSWPLVQNKMYPTLLQLLPVRARNSYHPHTENKYQISPQLLMKHQRRGVTASYFCRSASQRLG